MKMVDKVRKLFSIFLVPRWRNALRHQVAAGVEHASALRRLGEIATVVDIGANRGQFSLVARHCFPDARIFSFEPLGRPAAVYRKVFAHDPQTSLVESAIGAARGQATIHISARDDSSSLLPIATAQETLFPGTAEVGTQQIQVARLADHLTRAEIQKPAFLKLDVQGFELVALAGCEELLADFDWVYAECSFVELYAGQAFADEVIAWLRERDFQLVGIFNVACDAGGNSVQADFMFKRAGVRIVSDGEAGSSPILWGTKRGQVHY